jgi:hypothetical protein
MDTVTETKQNESSKTLRKQKTIKTQYGKRNERTGAKEMKK